MAGDSRSVEGTGRLRSYLLPPGAVGALYGSGCFHLSSRFSVSSMINCVGRTSQHALMSSPPLCCPLHPSFVLFSLPWRPFNCLLPIFGSAYPLLSRLCDVLVRFEEAADVHGLAAPDIAVDRPVEGKLERAAVKRAGTGIRDLLRAHARRRSKWCSQDLGLGGHGWWWCWPSRPGNGSRGETGSFVNMQPRLFHG